MKTVLFATTALVAFAGAAAAEVAVSGDARIGLRYDSDELYTVFNVDGDPVGVNTRDTWNVVSRARVHFTMTGETDSGLAFGAELRADQAGNANRGSNASNTEGVVYLSGAYGKLSAGDVDSALENAVGDLPEIGVSGLNYYNEFQYTTTDYTDSSFFNQATLLYEYKFGDASIYASFMDKYTGFSSNRFDGDAYSLGAGYTLGNYTFGIGYESANLFVDPVGYTYSNQDFSLDNTDFGGTEPLLNAYNNESRTWGISGGTSWMGVTFKAIYLNTKAEGSLAPGSWAIDDYKISQYGLGAEYKMANGVQLAGFYRKIDGDNLVFPGSGFVAENKMDIYGIGAGYDLGGGAVVKAGIAHIDGSTANPVYANPIDGDLDFKRTVADFGLQLSF